MVGCTRSITTMMWHIGLRLEETFRALVEKMTLTHMLWSSEVAMATMVVVGFYRVNVHGLLYVILVGCCLLVPRRLVIRFWRVLVVALLAGVLAQYTFLVINRLDLHQFGLLPSVQLWLSLNTDEASLAAEFLLLYLISIQWDTSAHYHKGLVTQVPTGAYRTRMLVEESKLADVLSGAL